MTKTNHFRIDVYECVVYVVLSSNIEKAIQSRVRLDGHSDYQDGDVYGYSYRPDCCVDRYYIFLNTYGLTIDTVNHEKSHIVEWILTDRGIKPVGEARAYLDGYISHKISLLLKRNKLKV